MSMHSRYITQSFDCEINCFAEDRRSMDITVNRFVEMRNTTQKE